MISNHGTKILNMYIQILYIIAQQYRFIDIIKINCFKLVTIFNTIF